MLSPIAADHVCNPRNTGPLEGFTHMGQVGLPGEGAFIQLWFRVEGGVIERAAYKTHGCGWSIACASVFCQLVTNRTLSQAGLVNPRDIEIVLGGVPEGKQEFPTMIVEAFKNIGTKENA